MIRLKDNDIQSSRDKAGIIERYLFLSPSGKDFIKDIQFADELKIGDNHVQLYTLADAQQTIKKLESKKLRLQSLADYSRENAIARDAVNDFLNECIAEQSLPVKAHFNLLCWTNNKEELKDIRNSVTTSLAQIDATAKQETAGAAQIF